MLDPATLDSRPRRACIVCDEPGEPQHANLPDRLFGVPGEWSYRRCTNGSCGLLWLDPTPLDEELGKAYGDYYTHAGGAGGAHGTSLPRRLYARVQRGYHALRWGREDVSRLDRLAGALLYLHPGRRADADFDAMYLRVRPGGRLLDVGCGSGRVLQTLTDIGWDGRGIDFDPRAIEAARERGLSADVGGLPEQHYPDASFDALVASHVLEHIPDPLSFLRECARVLAPSGRMVLVTPNADGLGHRRFGAHWRGLEPPRHLNVFTPASLIRLASEAGLSNVRVYTTPRNARGIYLTSRTIAAAAARNESCGAPPAPGPRAELWQLVTWLGMLARPELGEELVLEASP